MAKSLSKIMGQIEKLQKEAAAIQTTVITRIKREIAQYGLTAEHLYGSSKSTFIGNGQASGAKSATKAGTAKPAKFVDDSGNSWHGVGKRPQWIHDAIADGRSLGEFLVGAKKVAPATKKVRPAAKAVPTKVKKVAAEKRATPAKQAAKPPKVLDAVKLAVKTPAKKAAKAAPVKRTTAKKLAKAVPAEAAQTDQANA